ncbi:MAG: (Fe-S)-binding protein [Pseudomonadota bacterium]
MTDSALSDTDTILELADCCVMCGLCLPHCPTYRLLRNEADSPRGRISLMQAVAGGKLEPSDSLLSHLDRCLACRACERMCPSQVEYGKLIDTTRASLHSPRPKRLNRLLETVSDKSRLKRTASALRAYQQSGMQWLARKSGVLKGLDLEALEGTLPHLPKTVELHEYYPPKGQARGKLGLFVGCIGSILEGEIHLATITLLTTLGYGVHIPRQQGCCGSLHQHNGETGTASSLAGENIAAFTGLELDAIISTASGCAAQLFEYEADYGEPLPAPLYEVCDFLQEHWPESGIALGQQSMEVALHLPCTQRNVLRKPDAMEKLLSHIPELTVKPLPGNDQCCGAAGSYLLTETAIANALREPKLDAIDKERPALLISNNTGCALHLAAGMKGRGVEIEVVHPVVLMARSLQG